MRVFSPASGMRRQRAFPCVGQYTNVKGVLEGVRYFGTSVTRWEKSRFLRGSGRYVDDSKCPGLLHAMIVSSVHAHARIKALHGRRGDARKAP